MGLRFEAARHYSYKEPNETPTARILMASDIEGAVFRGQSRSRHVEGDNLLIPYVPEDEAKAIEEGDLDPLKNYVFNTERGGVYVAKRKLYIAEKVGRLLRYRLHLPDDGQVKEYVPGENGVVPVRSLWDFRIYN
jgi:hypothetical protein